MNVVDFVECFAVRTLNVAGPRESKFPGLQEQVADIMSAALRELLR